MKWTDDSYALEKADIDDLTANSLVIPIIRMNSIWFMTDSFGVTLNVEKMIVKSVPKKTFQDHMLLSKCYDETKVNVEDSSNKIEIEPENEEMESED